VVGSGSHEEQTDKMHIAIEEVILKEKSDLVIISVLQILS